MTSKASKAKVKTNDEICVFCNQCLSNDTDKDNKCSVILGKMLKYNKIYAHYYCLLLSSGLSQNGKDNEGMFGFLIKDIKKEVKRGEKLKCSYCKKSGATIGCSNRSCKKCFHLPCGLQNKTMSQFFGSFNSYCINHRPKQSLESIEGKDVNKECAVCYLNVEFDLGIDVLSTPCCSKIFHRICLQRQALSAGYFYKCPLCNNTNLFKEEMICFGIYVPKQDASWETENNAFGELYERHSRCDVQICVCPQGRHHYQENGVWKLFICNTCGSEGVHMKCALIIDQNTIWICDQCKRVEEKAKKRCETKRLCNQSVGEENEIEIIEMINTPSSSSFSNRRALNTVNNRFHRKRIRLSTNSGQRIEIDVDKERPKLLPNNTGNNEIEMSNKKDIGIQCLLVDDKDLIDCHPIDNIDWNSSKNETIIRPKNDSNLIQIENSDDDECLIID